MKDEIIFKIYDLLKKPEHIDGLMVDDIIAKLNISRNSFYDNIRELLLNDYVIKNTGIPRYYKYNTAKG